MEGKKANKRMDLLMFFVVVVELERFQTCDHRHGILNESERS